MSRRLLMSALWASTTAVATAVAWAGTSVVTATVTNSHPPAIAAGAVRAAVHAHGGTSEAPAPTTAAQGNGVAPPASQAAGGAAASGGGVPSPPASGASYGSAQAYGSSPSPTSGDQAPPSQPAPPSPSSPPSGTSSPPPSAAQPATSGQTRTGGSDDNHTGSVPAAQSTAPPSSASATFADAGGTVTVACHGTSISLTSATPFDGYSLNVQSSGPSRVIATFTSSRSYTISAYCNDLGQPQQASWGGGGGHDD